MHFLQISCQCSAVAAVLSEQWNWEAGDEGWRQLVSSGARGKRAESTGCPSCGANPGSCVKKLNQIFWDANEWDFGLWSAWAKEKFSSHSCQWLECSLLAPKRSVLGILRLCGVQGGCFPNIQNCVQHLWTPKLPALAESRGRVSTRSSWLPLTLAHACLSRDFYKKY